MPSQTNVGVCGGISRQTLLAGLFTTIIPSTMDIFGKIILDEFHTLPLLSILVDAVLLFILLMLLFLYTNIISHTNVMVSPFWITKLFRNITNHSHLKCILFLILLALFWSGNCIFTYLATLCDVPSFVGMLKGFVSPGLLLASCLFGGKEQLSILKTVSILFYTFGEILIDYGEVAFSFNCLFMAMVAVCCTTGKYFMIEKVMNCKLSNKIDYNLPFDPNSDDFIESEILLSSNEVTIHSTSDTKESIESIELMQLSNEVTIKSDTIESTELIQSIPSLLAFGYILPPQIIIGTIVFMNTEYENVMYNEESESYKGARIPWYWYSRIIQNCVFAVIYWAEIHLVSEFSAVYMMVFGAIRNVATLALSWIILKYKLTLYGWLGYATAIITVSLFQYARTFDKPQK